MRFNTAFILAAAFKIVSASTNVSSSTVSISPLTVNASTSLATAQTLESTREDLEHVHQPFQQDHLQDADAHQYHLASRLYDITDIMLSMVQYLDFNFDRFRFHSDEISKRLSMLDLAIKQLSPPRHDLLEKLDFSHRVFDEMSEAIQYESLFPKAQGEDYSIALSIVEVNLNLLSFFDDSGRPRPDLPVWHSRNGRVYDLTTESPADGYLDAYQYRFDN